MKKALRRGDSHNLEMSPADKLKSIKGETCQGNYLCEAKERNSETKSRKVNRL